MTNSLSQIIASIYVGLIIIGSLGTKKLPFQFGAPCVFKSNIRRDYSGILRVWQVISAKAAERMKLAFPSGAHVMDLTLHPAIEARSVAHH